jgi:hypothetical protein
VTGPLAGRDVTPARDANHCPTVAHPANERGLIVPEVFDIDLAPASMRYRECMCKPPRHLAVQPRTSSRVPVHEPGDSGLADAPVSVAVGVPGVLGVASAHVSP